MYTRECEHIGHNVVKSNSVDKKHVVELNLYEIV